MSQAPKLGNDHLHVIGNGQPAISRPSSVPGAAAGVLL